MEQLAGFHYTGSFLLVQIVSDKKVWKKRRFCNVCIRMDIPGSRLDLEYNG